MIDLNLNDPELTRPKTDHEKKVDAVYEKWAIVQNKRLTMWALLGTLNRPNICVG